MAKAEVLGRVHTGGLVPVIRAKSDEQGIRLIEAIAAGGISVMEITLTIPQAVQLIRRVAKHHPGILVGAGTVLDPETANVCISEGAQFIVSPALNLKTLELCNRVDIAVMPGALTPTEIVTAWQHGADVVKVFPASSMGGAQYLRSLKAPLPQIRVIPTGGVTIANALEFLEGGAFALGVGADLVDVKALSEGRNDTITSSAKEYVNLVHSFREAKQASALRNVVRS